MATLYCTEADIIENIRGIVFSASSAVTETALANMIIGESQFIDGQIQGRYDLPLSDPDALIFLKKICIDLVVYRVTKVLFPKDQLPLPNEKPVQIISTGSAYRVALKWLTDVRDGVSTIPNTPTKSVKFFSSEGVDNQNEGEFKKR